MRCDETAGAQARFLLQVKLLPRATGMMLLHPSCLHQHHVLAVLLLLGTDRFVLIQAALEHRFATANV